LRTSHDPAIQNPPKTAKMGKFTLKFQVLSYGNKVSNPSTGHITPTYVFPADIVACIRGRFPDPNAGKHDNQYSTEKTENVYNVAWSDVMRVKCPTPPKACTKCGAKSAKKPY